MNKNRLTEFDTYIRSEIGAGNNPLTALIIYKPDILNFKKRWWIWLFRRFLSKYYTPTFDFLCCVYDFVIEMENILIYQNEKTNHIYAMRDLKKGVKSFSLKGFTPCGEDGMNAGEYSIEYTLYPDESIGITIRRAWGDNIKTMISFKAGSPLELSISDQIMFDKIISDTMKAVVAAFNDCYFRYDPIPMKTNNEEDQFIHH